MLATTRITLSKQQNYYVIRAAQGNEQMNKFMNGATMGRWLTLITKSSSSDLRVIRSSRGEIPFVDLMPMYYYLKSVARNSHAVHMLMREIRQKADRHLKLLKELSYYVYPGGRQRMHQWSDKDMVKTIKLEKARNVPKGIPLMDHNALLSQVGIGR